MLNLDEVHQHFLAGEKVTVIAHKFGVSEGYIQQLISQQRKLNPEKWPSRKRRTSFQLFHVYECEDCIVTFAVEQDYEDQSDVCCPICWNGEKIRDVSSGEMILRG